MQQPIRVMGTVIIHTSVITIDQVICGCPIYVCCADHLHWLPLIMMVGVSLIFGYIARINLE